MHCKKDYEDNREYKTSICDECLKNKKEKVLCYVCGKEKKPYFVFVTNDPISMLRHLRVREDGEICQRCDRYHAMTGILKEPTDEEFEEAIKQVKLRKTM